MQKRLWDKISGRNNELEKRYVNKKVNSLNMEIKKNVREDEREHLLEQIRESKEDPHNKHLLKTVKNLKGKFTPKFIQMRNKNEMLVPLRKRAEAIPDYLEQQHWQNNPAVGESRQTNRGFLGKIQKQELASKAGKENHSKRKQMKKQSN